VEQVITTEGKVLVELLLGMVYDPSPPVHYTHRRTVFMVSEPLIKLAIIWM